MTYLFSQDVPNSDVAVAVYSGELVVTLEVVGEDPEFGGDRDHYVTLHKGQVLALIDALKSAQKTVDEAENGEGV